jgi:hypothetical protein
MRTSLEVFPRSILDKMLDICWSQWSALGVYAGIAPEKNRIIDLEALLCATMFYGRYDPRLFDEALDWIATNARIISLDRLKMIAEIFGPSCKACLGASLEYLGKNTNNRRLLSLIDRWNDFRLKKEESLFLSWGSGKALPVKQGDPDFLAWGFLRNKPILRGLSAKPDLSNDANLFLRLRKLFGVTSRASVFGYLLLKGEGNSMQISKALYVNQRNVYGILGELAEGRFLLQWSGKRESVFSIDRESWLDFLGVRRDLVYIGWVEFFLAFQLFLDDWAANPEAYSTEYLASSRLREKTPDLLGLLRDAGMEPRFADPVGQHGDAYFHALAEGLTAYLD